MFFRFLDMDIATHCFFITMSLFQKNKTNDNSFFFSRTVLNIVLLFHFDIVISLYLF